MKNLKQLTLVSAMIAAASLGAQENHGTIVGTVRAPNGNPVAGATITIRGSQLLGDRPAQTDAQGNYRLPLLLPGQYTVTASAQGFVMSNRAAVNITGGSTIRVDLSLRSIDTREETVEVVATENPIIDKTETKLASTYTADQLQNLATGTSGMYAALFLSPGVQGSESYTRMRGGMAGSAQYMINGMVAKDNTAGQGRQYEMMIDDLLQDVQVIQNPINAKYGFSQSGLIMATTKTGTNEFQGSFRTRLSNAAWRTYTNAPIFNRWNELEEGYPYRAPYYSMNSNPSNDQMGRSYDITFSGPIIKDRLTFTYGAHIVTRSQSSGNKTNVLNADPTQNSAYMPGLIAGDPRYQGPTPAGLTGQTPGVMADYYGGYLWGSTSPTVPMPWVVNASNNVYTYKLYWQINANHQIDFNYTTNPYTSGYDSGNISGWMAEAGEGMNVQQGSTRINRGLGYRGIIGASGVLSATYGDTYSNVYWASGPKDPVYVTLWGRANSEFILRDRTSVSRPLAGGQTGNKEIRGNTTYSLDYNHIWENHNIDVGVQMLVENLTVWPNAGDVNGRIFYSPGRRYDGGYMVFDTLNPTGPLYTGIGLGDADIPIRTDVTTHRNFLFNNYLVPTYRNMNADADDLGIKGTTTSFYLNDNWTLNDNWAINLGLRVDNNKFDDIRGELLNTTTISPRLRIQYDLGGDNKHVFSFSATQRNGTISPGQLGRAYAVSGTSQSRTYLWTGENNPKPNDGREVWREYFVNWDAITDPGNYRNYWAYSNTAANWSVDPGLKPQLTTEFELFYRRAFDQGGYFRVAFIYNFLSNGMVSQLVDEAQRLDDPSGEIPTAGFTYNFKRYLQNDSTRGRHYASAEMEWMVPLINKESYKLNWHGNWTIAKTTGNSVFSSFFGSTAMGETDTIRWFEIANSELGMPMEYLDPWGELNTPRHIAKTWFQYTHGVRGGIVNSVSLLGYYELGVPNIFNHTFNIPNNTFKSATTNGGLVPTANLPTSVILHPYGRGYRRAEDIYYCDLQWNVTIPLKDRLSLFLEITIGNPFNSIYTTTTVASYTSGNTTYPLFISGTNPTWVRGQNPTDYPLWGKQFADLWAGEYFGVPSGRQGQRQFNAQFDIGFRF